MGAARTGRGSRGGRRNDGWRASSETGASSVTMARGKAEALGTLVEATVLLLVAFSSTDEAGITILRMGWGKDRVSLIEKGFPSVGSFLSFLGA